jgi:hypothetical protein
MSCSEEKGSVNVIITQRIAQKGREFPDEAVTIKESQCLELTMLELLKSLVFAVIMVPVVMAIILGLIYGLGEVFNVLSNVGHKDNGQQSKQHH